MTRRNPLLLLLIAAVTLLPVVAHSAPPSEVDWRSHGAVTPVKDQGQCGSSYAFAATGAIEGALAIAGKGLISISEQQILDCSRGNGNHGCNGGWVDKTFDFAKQHGIVTESSYPYTAKDGTCRTSNPFARITGFTRVAIGMASLMTAVAQQPVAAAVHIPSLPYRGGVVCWSGQPNEAVLIIGYGTYAGRDVWLVKNSWGTGWGQAGYVFLERSARCPIVEAWVPHVQ